MGYVTRDCCFPGLVPNNIYIISLRRSVKKGPAALYTVSLCNRQDTPSFDQNSLLATKSLSLKLYHSIFLFRVTYLQMIKSIIDYQTLTTLLNQHAITYPFRKK